MELFRSRVIHNDCSTSHETTVGINMGQQASMELYTARNEQRNDMEVLHSEAIVTRVQCATWGITTWGTGFQYG